MLVQSIASALLLGAAASAETIAQINGEKFISSFRGKQVTNVTGLVTAKGPDGIFLRSTTPDKDPRTSESVYVFNRTVGSNLTVGDIITLDGSVVEFRSNPAFIFLTELSNPKNVVKVSGGNKVVPLVIGKDTSPPPTQQYTSLDGGDIFKLPNNSSQISNVNPALEPKRFGLDFWESLSGELVTVRKPTAISKPNNFGDTWVVGDWKVTGRNKRGGVTMLDKDANPEAIIIGTPLDGTRNPNSTKLGDSLEEITGVVTYAFGFYRILPRTALKVTKSQTPALPPPSKLVQGKGCKELSVGVYNVENLSPQSEHLPLIAEHIVKYLQSPTVMFLEEVQDNNGPTNDAVTSANETLTALVNAISDISPVQYSFVDGPPVDDQDGGQPGGNIRTAYLYNPKLVRLRGGAAGGSPTDANEVLPGPHLKFNPGRIDPQNAAAWSASRKPLAAEWETLDGAHNFFTINVHFASKGGSSSIAGDARPPVNGVVEPRVLQAEVTASFVADILEADPQAAVIVAGDFNEFAFAPPLRRFVELSGLQDLDAAAGLPPTERYTYLFDMNCQQLDHVFVSGAVARAGPRYDHVHINTWATAAAQVSDHDPSVARLDVCKKKGRGGGYGN